MKQDIISKKIPPDGGYGWVIVLASALMNFFEMPMVHCFGLIYKDTFQDQGFTATEKSLIINVNGSFGRLVGIINGYLLKILGVRKVAFMGAFLVTLGLVLTSFCHSPTGFLIAYGLIYSLGDGMNQSAYSLALNLYFKKKRNVAMGYAMGITGSGQILVPQLIGFLLMYYTAEGTTLICSAIAAHSFISACLLQPVKWHMKRKEEEQQPLEASLEDRNSDKENQSLARMREQNESLFNSVLDLETESKNNFLKTLAKIFDLDLLKDPIFVNITVGLSIAIFAELNFTMLTPFMLKEYDLSTSEIATFLSTLGISDIISRFLAPYIGNYFTKPPRLMYTYSLIFLIITRFTFILTRNFKILLVVALGLGVAKGVRRVYMHLVIPAHVPLEKLPSACGMEMMLNGLCILLGGTFLGYIRDVTGNYRLCVVMMNSFTMFTLFIWIVEFVIVRYFKKRSSRCGNREDISFGAVSTSKD